MSLNIQDMMAKVQELQSRMGDVQAKLRALETTAEVGGGMVTVTINGKQEVKKIKLEKSVVTPDDIELLEDLILSAVNKAIDQSQKMAQEEMGKATSGMIPNIPGLDLGNLGM
ncbi:MAG: YbaB/EbfC family nucleoid-associated protein [Bacteroidota bacterium]